MSVFKRITEMLRDYGRWKGVKYINDKGSENYIPVSKAIEIVNAAEQQWNESNGILLTQGTDGVFHQLEAFATIFCHTKEDYEKAKEAFEKQKPKKPDLEGDGYWDGKIVYDTWICPCCEERYEVDYEEYDHCPKCGQAIDWSK